ncbi:MAG TPA: class I adenylate-forming enzyme family protein [Streptomyces sp.]|uniref:class I adenylate-forming enzyme family protein n=1 Tax=Streptomyces sp. TaxID=1931 RepID=UPI002B7A156D|nr:class I adenylate-forming enzyme family protein [Streptomyces sp.]HWU04799.1 class I adenylate-forming enzyme family protein [Streptomyces sp.]
MNIAVILEMAASAEDRPAVTEGGRTLSVAELQRLAQHAATRFRGRTAVLYLGPNHPAYPVALFGAALANIPFVPLNYRLGEEQLGALIERHPGAEVLNPADLDALITAPGTAEWLPAPQDQEAVAVVLYTSGTTAAPKAALLRHRHLLAYVFNTQDFGSAEPSDASLVALPPYHVAGLMNLLTNLYAGRRVVYQSVFQPADWLETVRREGVSHAMVVPTMLARLTAELADAEADVPTLRNLAYGGARCPRPVMERALRQFPDTGFVNAYGLTETASSICVLGPDDHWQAAGAEDPAVRARLGSVGRPLPGVEVEIRNEDGKRLGADETGLVFVRGAQISGEYEGVDGSEDGGGWFATRDRGRLDEEGYLFLEGRADETIIRGGENIAPAEIEDVLLQHPGVQEAAVLGLPDPEWGQRLVAVLVGDGDQEEIRSFVKRRLRSSKTPDAVVFRPELPRTATGKLLRRTLVAELAEPEETTDA